MLVLTRKNGQKLIINDNIEVVIVDSYNGSVKIGINAPKDVAIYREEIWREIQAVNKQSPSSDFSDMDQLSGLVNNRSLGEHKKIRKFINKINH